MLIEEHIILRCRQRWWGVHIHPSSLSSFTLQERFQRMNFYVCTLTFLYWNTNKLILNTATDYLKQKEWLADGLLDSILIPVKMQPGQCSDLFISWVYAVYAYVFTAMLVSILTVECSIGRQWLNLNVFFHDSPQTRSLMEAQGWYFGYTSWSVSYGNLPFSALPQPLG